MNDYSAITNKLIVIFNATEDALNEWTGTGNLQFPTLFTMIAVKMNWDDKQMREADPIIRYYVRNNPNWDITRGAKGGIRRMADKLKKEQAKSAKDAAKKQIQDLLAAKLMNPANNNDSSVESEENDDIDEDEE